MMLFLNHIQIALPAGTEIIMRAFYCDVLGLREMNKPDALQATGGFWAMSGNLQIHFDVDLEFGPATKAHAAFGLSNLSALADKLTYSGYPPTWDKSLADVKRFFVNDPVGNRIELMAIDDRAGAHP